MLMLHATWLVFQVHEAWLDGKRYAVKVQRPGLKDLFEVDLKSIGALAAVLDKFDPKLDGASRYGMNCQLQGQEKET